MPPVPSPQTTPPTHLRLGQLIARLAEEDRARIVPVGFHNPHSYRGYYEDLAFERATNITVGEMLSAAKSALGATYQGWKGGDYQMGEWTSTWLVSCEGETGESIGGMFLDLLLAATPDGAGGPPDAVLGGPQLTGRAMGDVLYSRHPDTILCVRTPDGLRPISGISTTTAVTGPSQVSEVLVIEPEVTA